MYNLTEYSDNYSKTSGSLQQYCKEVPAVNNDEIVDFNGANTTDAFNFKTKIIGQTNDDGIIKIQIMVPLKHLSNFWRTLEMILINCELELILDWLAICVIIYTNVANQVPTFTETNLYFPVVTLCTNDHSKLLPQLKNGFKRTITWNKYIVKPYEKTYENIRNIAIGHGDDYTTGSLLDYTYYKKYYKMIAIDLNKQQALDAVPKAIQQIDFTANLDRDGNTRFYLNYF